MYQGLIYLLFAASTAREQTVNLIMVTKVTSFFVKGSVSLIYVCLSLHYQTNVSFCGKRKESKKLLT